MDIYGGAKQTTSGSLYGVSSSEPAAGQFAAYGNNSTTGHTGSLYAAKPTGDAVPLAAAPAAAAASTTTKPFRINISVKAYDDGQSAVKVWTTADAADGFPSAAAVKLTSSATVASVTEAVKDYVEDNAATAVVEKITFEGACGEL